MTRKLSHEINNFLRDNKITQTEFGLMMHDEVGQGAVQLWRVNGVSRERAAEIEVITTVNSGLFHEPLKAATLRPDDPPTIIQAYVEQAFKDLQ